MALGSNSIPVPGSPSRGDLSPVEVGLSPGGDVGDGAGSSERMPQASRTGTTKAANADFHRGPESLSAVHRFEREAMGSADMTSNRVGRS